MEVEIEIEIDMGMEMAMERVRGRRRPRRTKNVSSSFISDHLISEILLRTPAKSVLRFKFLCKRWCSIIKNPNFIQEHSDHHLQKNPCFGLAALHNFSDERGHTLARFEVIEEEEMRNHGIGDMKKPKIKIHETDSRTRMGSCIVSCNGLLCFYLYMFYICNPTTKELVILPLEPSDSRVEAFGFGYDSVNRKYKVVELLRESLYGYNEQSPLECTLNVFTLGDASNSWRSTVLAGNDEDFLGRDDIVLRNLGRYVDGSIYWIIAKYGVDKCCTSILCFDVRLEKFRVKKLPNGINFCRDRDRTTLVELKGKRLGLGKHCHEKHILDIWMLNEDSTTMQDLWIKEYSIDVSSIYDYYSGPCGIQKRTLVGYMNNKLLIETTRELISYNLESKRPEDSFPNLARYFEVYMRSIISLRDMVMQG